MRVYVPGEGFGTVVARVKNNGLEMVKVELDSGFQTHTMPDFLEMAGPRLVYTAVDGCRPCDTE